MAANGKDRSKVMERMDRFEETITANARTMRDLIKQAIEGFGDRRRSIDDECGYPHSIDAEKFWNMYLRDPIAARVIELYPRECFQVHPQVFETEDASETEFERDFSNLLRDEDNYYKQDEGNPIWAHVLRGDILSGIGRYGVQVMGFDDGEQDWRNPVNPKKGMRLLNLAEYPEHLAQITQFDNDPTSKRYGYPVMYAIKTASEDDAGSSKVMEVHWTRIIHLLPDNPASSEVYGIPRCLPVYNHLYNLQKIYGADGEGYWRSCFMGLSIETHPSLGRDGEIPEDKTRDVLENYFNGLQRYLAISGASVKTLSPQVVDLTPHADAQLAAVCIRLRCPIRIFTGSERGQLASDQDSVAWINNISHSQNYQRTPRNIVPLVNRLIWAGCLAKPKPLNGFKVYWPDISSRTEQGKAAVLLNRTTSLTAYIRGNGDALVAPRDYLIRFMEFSADEADAILAEAMTYADDREVVDGQDTKGQSGALGKSSSGNDNTTTITVSD